MTLPDYSKWLSPERLQEEERQWGDPEKATWPYFVRAIESLNPHLAHVPPRGVLEFGCGTGWVAAALPSFVNYFGVDANEFCINLARIRCPDRRFIHADIRHYLPTGTERIDLVCAFSFLKHFSLGEWPTIVGLMLSRAPLGLFSMRIGRETMDDGTEFPHLQVTPQMLEETVSDAGHRVVSVERLPWGEVMVTTCR